MPADDAPAVVEATLGEEFEITLEAVPTSGFQWEADPTPDPGRVELLGATEEAAARPVGAPGLQRFRYRALEAGTIDLRFVLRRPWESRPPVEERTIRVTVAP